MQFDPGLLGTVDEFLSYAMTAVVIITIYYVIKFFLLGKSDENWSKGTEGLSDFVKKKAEESKRKKEEKKAEAARIAKEKADQDAEGKKGTAEQNKTDKKRQKAPKRVKTLTDYLMAVVAAISKSIETLPSDPEEAKKWFARAKRSMTRARDSNILEEIANGTPYLDQARMLRSHIVEGRSKMDSFEINVENLKNFNQFIGAIIKHIGELVEKVYGHKEASVAAEDKVDEAAKKAADAKKATGAKLLGRVLNNRRLNSGKNK